MKENITKIIDERLNEPTKFRYIKDNVMNTRDIYKLAGIGILPNESIRAIVHYDSIGEYPIKAIDVGRENKRNIFSIIKEKFKKKSIEDGPIKRF